jgi:acetyl-CoA C-acetyltransferase
VSEVRAVYVLEALRTPRGLARPEGKLAGVRPIDLVAGLLRALVARTGLDTSRVADVVLGCSTQTREQGANVAKIAALVAGYAEGVPGVTLNRFCASGLDAIAYGALQVAAGGAELVVAGGVESMSRVPILSDEGAWFADPEIADKTGFVPMGVAADLLASLRGHTRERLDAVALASHRRAARARDEGWLAAPIVPVRDAEGAVVLDRDEGVRDGLTAERLARLAPAFAELGAAGAGARALARYPGLARVEHLHTVATSPLMADGASALLLGTRDAAEGLGLRPRARIRATATASVEPTLMLTGNVPAVERALARAGVGLRDVDRFECNESFASTILDFTDRLGLDPEAVSPDGGALALGHPLGATGGVLVATLLAGLERTGGAIGVASTCAGAGLAEAVVIERV